jgi:hypothetical protein
MKFLNYDFPSIEEIKASVDEDFQKEYSDRPEWLKDTMLAARLAVYYENIYICLETAQKVYKISEQ